MEAKAGPARQLQDVDDAGATVENQLPLVQKQLRAMMPELLSAMYLVGRHAGEDRRVEMACILIAHACNLSECMPNACNLSESSESC